jgi:flagellar hook-associated protein 2
MVGSIGYSLGIGSGLDIKSIVDGLAQAERAPKEALIKRREEANTARVSALADAAAGIDSFTTALSNLIGGGSLFSQPSVSDPNLLGATAVPGARLSELSAQIEVVQLAKAQTLQSGSLAGASSPVGQGELTLSTAAGSFTITIDGSNDSLSGLVAAINGKASGVTASIVTDPSGARLVLKGATGEANAFSLSVPEGTASGLERFAFGPGVAGGMSAAQTAQDAVVRLDGVEVRRASNGFKDLIEGVQIDLKRAAPGSVINLGLSRPSAAIEQALSDFVTAYNEFTKALGRQTSAGQGGAGAGPLRGDLGARELQRQLAQLPSQVLNSQGPIRTLSEIGVSTNRDGTLALNAARLKSVLERDPLGVEALFNPVQYSSDPAVAITSPMGRTKPGSYVLTDLVPASGATPASGLFDGVAAVANGSFLSAPSTARALGLAVEVKAAAAQVTITVDPGLGGALQAIRDAVRTRTGPIAQSQQKLAAEAKDIARDRQQLETRSAAYLAKLTADFTAMERRVSAFKATQSYLEQQVKIWTSSND